MRGEPEVEADDRRLLAPERRERLGAALGEEEREVVAQRVLELRADRFLILDDEQLGLHVRPPNGRRTETAAPEPSGLDPSTAPWWGASRRRPSNDVIPFWARIV